MLSIIAGSTPAGQEAPAAGAEQKAEVIPAARVVDSIDGYIVAEQATDETQRGDESMKQPGKEAILTALQAGLYGFSIGAGS